jgi:hypothetical protein
VKYFYCQNNGVVAVASEETLNDIRKKNAIRYVLTDAIHQVQGRDYSKPLTEGLKHFGTPVIFTFTRNHERFEGSPWFTGDIDLFTNLRKCADHTFEEAGFYVPFSNGCEIGIHGDEAMASELEYVTTDKQFYDAFGVTRTELTTLRRDFEQLLVAQLK